MAEEANTLGAHLLCYDRPGYGGSTPHPKRTVADSDFDYFEGMPEKKRKQRNLYFSDPVGFRQHLQESREEIMNATEEFLATKLQAMPVEERVSKSFYLYSYETMCLAVENGIEGYWEDYQAFFSEWEVDFARNTTPIQLWHGQGDMDVPYQHSQWQSRAIPHSELHLTHMDGHFSILENHRVEIMEWLLSHF